MLKIFILIFTAGLVLYIASAILVKIDETVALKKQKNSILIRSLIVIWKKIKGFQKTVSHFSMCL